MTTMFTSEFLAKFSSAVAAALSHGGVVTAPQAARLGCEAAFRVFDENGEVDAEATAEAVTEATGLGFEADEDVAWAGLFRLTCKAGKLPYILVKGPFGGVKREGWQSKANQPKAPKAPKAKGKAAPTRVTPGAQCVAPSAPGATAAAAAE